MKNKLAIILLIITLVNGQSQNLVPNPSFEEYIICPDYENQIELATGWKNFGGTPDYFNSCSSLNYVSVPSWGCGYQYPATGNAFAGLFTYWKDPSKQGPYIAEYIGTQLISTLQKNTTYYISFKISLGLDKCLNCASNNIGILFSTVPFDIYNDSIAVPPLIRNYAHLNSNTIITDTVNWVTINGSIVADSTYQYLIIGNFFDTTHISLFPFDSLGFCEPYYYIDDIYVSTVPLNINETEFINKNRVYSNPTTGKIYFKLSQTTETKICIYNLIGYLIKEINILGVEQFEIETKNWDSGVYIIKEETNKNIIIQKILVNK